MRPASVNSVVARLFFLFTVLLLMKSQDVLAQRITIRGTVTDAVTKKPIAYASVYIKDIQIGVTTDKSGKFTLKTNVVKLPFDIVFSATDFVKEEVKVVENNQSVRVALRPRPVIFTDDRIEAASLSKESLLESPVTINYLDNRMVRSAPSANFYDMLGNLKEVQLNTNSLAFNSLNARGFATFNNGRFVQIIDGMNNAPPGLNFALGNLVGISELDIDNIELIPGTASALYGPNAFNGIVFLNSKDPFQYQGLSAMVKTGANMQEATGTQPFWETAVRLGGVVGEAKRLGFKFNFSMMQGQDWIADDTTDIDQNPINEPFRGANSPSYDGVNVYGDEIAQTINIDEIVRQLIGSSLNLPSIRVARTGYAEKYITDNKAQSIKLDGAIHYKLTPNMQLIGQVRYGKGSSVYQGTNRIAFRDVSQRQFKLEVKDPNFVIRAYHSQEDSGDSYDTRFAAWNINRYWKSDLDWFTQYTQAYIASLLGLGIPQATTPMEAHGFARSIADEGRLTPDDPKFAEVRDSILQITDLARGSKVVDKSSIFRVEANYNLANIFKPIQLQFGGNFQRYNLNSQGTLFNDADGPISYSEFGLLLKAGKSFFDRKRLNITGFARYDKNDNFEGIFTYRGSSVLSLGPEKEHNFRASYQTGFRYPDPPGQFLAINLGVVRSLGGTEENINNYELEVDYFDDFGDLQTTLVQGPKIYANSYTATSVQQFSAAFSESIADGESPVNAATLNAPILQPLEIDFIRPEKITSWEIGYKGLIQQKLLIDFNFFHSRYKDFHAFTNAVHVLTGDVNDASGLLDVINNRFTTFELIQNAPGTVALRGVGLGLNYAFKRSFTLGGNYTFLSTKADGDANPELLPGLNAPKHKMVFSFGSYSVGKSKMGFLFNITFSDDYYWKARFASGPVNDYITIDLQANYRIPVVNTTVKIGATNLMNREYRQAIGTPSQGARYYISLVYNGTKRFF
ncbi:MAG: TonB-dependent receptor [Bacteroidota bacterium]